jgi:hypothetical protein
MDREKSRFLQTIQRFTRLFASGVIVIGLLVLIGWYSKLMFLTRFSINEVPMAPSTAYVFVCLAVGLWFYLRPQKTAINRNAAIASAPIVICLSCLIVITNILKHYANWEHAFIKIPETHLNMPTGHMSLVTALLFLISGFALLFLQSNWKTVQTLISNALKYSDSKRSLEITVEDKIRLFTPSGIPAKELHKSIWIKFGMSFTASPHPQTKTVKELDLAW